MAVAENIKLAVQALEEEVCWAVNLGECLALAAGEDVPAWVVQYRKVLSSLSQKADDLFVAINEVQL